MASTRDTSWIVFDCESVVDGALLARTLYRGEGLEPGEAVRRYRQEEARARGRDPSEVFVPVTFHVPVAIATARVGPDLRIRDVACLDAPRFDPRSMVEQFWKGVQHYREAALVDFNGRSFDLPLLTLSAFRFGVSCPRYFDDDRFGFRYRFTEKHVDLLEWMTEYGAYRLRGGLDLLAKVLGKPGKMEVHGGDVEAMWSAGRRQEIGEYCLHDVLDTYFVFLRTRVLMGRVSLEDEQRIVEETRHDLEGRSEAMPALRQYLDAFGRWNPEPFT